MPVGWKDGAVAFNVEPLVPLVWGVMVAVGAILGLGSVPNGEMILIVFNWKRSSCFEVAVVYYDIPNCCWALKNITDYVVLYVENEFFPGPKPLSAGVSFALVTRLLSRSELPLGFGKIRVSNGWRSKKVAKSCVPAFRE